MLILLYSVHALMFQGTTVILDNYNLTFMVGIKFSKTLVVGIRYLWDYT